MAGYIGHVAGWKRFEIKSKQLFEAEKIPYFHAKLFHKNNKHFKGWTPARKIRFASRWLGFAKDNLLCGISAAANKEGHRAGKTLSKGKVNISYESHCMSIALSELMKDDEVYKEIAKYGLKIFIERSGSGDRGIQECLNEIIEANEISNYVKSVDFAGKKEICSIQLADYLAYYSQKFALTALNNCSDGITDYLKIAFDSVPTIMQMSESCKPDPKFRLLKKY